MNKWHARKKHTHPHIYTQMGGNMYEGYEKMPSPISSMKIVKHMNVILAAVVVHVWLCLKMQ